MVAQMNPCNYTYTKKKKSVKRKKILWDRSLRKMLGSEYGTLVRRNNLNQAFDESLTDVETWRPQRPKQMKETA